MIGLILHIAAVTAWVSALSVSAVLIAASVISWADTAPRRSRSWSASSSGFGE